MSRQVTPGQLIADLAGHGEEVLVGLHEATKLWTAELQAEVQRNASGRPGPNAPTGDYRRSINRRTERVSTAHFRGRVGTDKPQARRLEFGFQGTDSLGRSYDQPPYPHFGPAADAVGPKYVEAVEAVLVEARR